MALLGSYACLWSSQGKWVLMSHQRLQGDDITFLPAIVDAAESSPAAAAECARIIRKFLNRDYWTKPSYQYNAIMLIRILSDNPGPTFTRNLDKKFTEVTKDLLRNGRDPNVRQMLMETMDTFENTKGYDEGLGVIIEMWKKEKEKAYRAYGVSDARERERRVLYTDDGKRVSLKQCPEC